ncbi:MAG: hypothetical protein HY323_07240 [Betaproteobacteria bacterium]|nr:hypothetical protein [Betaproteobacteria bacterium]
MGEGLTGPFYRALARTLGHEGGYGNDPRDHGGATRWGITEAVARRHGYEGDMRALPVGVAQMIYDEDYWRPLRLDDVARWHEPVALELFDVGVNLGSVMAGRFLQIALNALNRAGELYPNLEVDGRIGPVTLAALPRLMLALDKLTCLKMLLCQRGTYYLALTERRETDEAFVRGWFGRVTL